MSEFDLIERIRARAARRDDVVLGIGDDAAIVRVPAGRELLVATDTLNRGVHFPENTLPAHIGWKALAVNLSDLAAMGGTPAWCTLSLSLPQADMAWLDSFLDGFVELARLHEVALIGGDTTRGPLSVSLTLVGHAAPDQALLRSGAEIGDEIWVSGTLGDAAGALAQWRSGAQVAAPLRLRLDRPTPRVDLGQTLVGVATSAIDISDGLMADLGHICRASRVGARIDVSALPLSNALRDRFDVAWRHSLQATGGDDYELCFTAPHSARSQLASVAEACAVPLTMIGTIVEGTSVRAHMGDGSPWMPTTTGYVHFT
ncbi:thiamine-phosphate kinase [Agrilutibacter solisilvae]|uniref:Thiamine-monophosphate kinase n=1 Tax=Agrilutibacter solisilvae TaxID=2763317 RepID=A0A975AS56_9GAMM|nr:thiamine-phosphate kinase [Lysobacter solisilvae]QSX78574.1 thiamine-phosphate kinase [Lysobacter solisilvae]